MKKQTSNFEEVELASILLKKGYIRGPFGSSLKRKDLLKKCIPVYEQQHAINNSRTFIFYIDEKKYNEMKRFRVEENDLIISCSGTVGKVSIIQAKDPKGIISQALLILRVDDSKVLPLYLKYYFMTSEGYNAIISRSSGSVQVNIAKREVIEHIKFKLPPIPDQKKIVKLLKSLDDKIELNNKINKNLLEQCCLLFDKIYYLGKPTTLNTLIEIVESGSRPKGGAENHGIPSLGAEKIECFGIYDFSNEKYISEEFYQNLKHGKVLSGDVLLYKDGAYTGKVSMSLDGFPHKKCAVNEHVFIIRTRNNFAQFFLYFLLSKNENKQQIIAMASSKAAQPGLNSQELLNINILLPENRIINEFEKSISPLMHKIASNAKVNESLIYLRDSLLPKLMSSEIDVSKIDI